MPDDFSVTYAALAAHRAALVTAARDLEDSLETAHGSDTGVQAPVGRTGLRESLEGTIGAVRARLRVGSEDVGTVSTRLESLEFQVEELDLSLGSGWKDVPL